MRGWLGTLGQDLGYAVRSFRRSPAFTLVALLSLTLGIGATTAIFSVIYGVLIAPYPYARPGEIWSPEIRAIEAAAAAATCSTSCRALAAIPAFSDVMATSMETVLMTGEFAPESFRGVLLTGNAFNFLGVPPVVGRTIQPTDIRPDGDAEPVVVLSHRLWLRLFEGNPSAIGRTLRLNGRPHTIIGVMPPRFGWYGNDGSGCRSSPTRTDVQCINPIVRLAPGMSNTVAEAQLKALNAAWRVEKPARFPAQRLHHHAAQLSGRHRRQRRDADQPAAAARRRGLPAAHRLRQRRQPAARARHRARRARWPCGCRSARRAPRLLRQLLTESVVLSLAGGVLGVLFAFVAIRSIVGADAGLLRAERVARHHRLPVLWFSLAVSLLTGMVFGLVPALQTSKAGCGRRAQGLAQHGAGAHGGRSRQRPASSSRSPCRWCCWSSAGLTIRTFVVRPAVVDPGFRRIGVLPSACRCRLRNTRRSSSGISFAQNCWSNASATARASRLPLRPAVWGTSVAVRIAGRPPDDSRRLTINLDRRGSPAGVRHSAARRADVRWRGSPARRSRRGDQPGRGQALARRGESDRRAHAARRSAASSGTALVDTNGSAEVTIVGIIADTEMLASRSEPVPAIAVPFSLIAPLQRTLAVRATAIRCFN